MCRRPLSYLARLLFCDDAGPSIFSKVNDWSIVKRLNFLLKSDFLLDIVVVFL